MPSNARSAAAGMGIVYKARDLKLDRPVAIKTLPPYVERDSAVRERFLREARTAASLSHANIIPIYRADEIPARDYATRSGRTRHGRIFRDPPDPDARRFRQTVEEEPEVSKVSRFQGFKVRNLLPWLWFLALPVSARSAAFLRVLCG